MNGDGIDPGVRKAAIAVLALGPDLAREIFSLSPDEISVFDRIESIRDVRAEEVQSSAGTQQSIGSQIAGISGHDYLLHRAAAEAIGEDRVALLMSDEQEQDEAKRVLINAARKDPAALRKY